MKDLSKFSDDDLRATLAFLGWRRVIRRPKSWRFISSIIKARIAIKYELELRAAFNAAAAGRKGNWND